jgi:hypothetical protein
VFVDNHSIFEPHDDAVTSRRFGWFYRTANSLHVKTRRSVIARELLLGPGDCYDPWLVEESERVLRSYNFLASVEIYGVPQADGSYHLVVDTRDDWSTQGDIRISLRSGLEFEGARVRETNLLGRGETLSAYYIHRDVTRDYGVRFFTPQLARTRWDLDAEFGGTRAGTIFSEALSYPFVGEVSRWAAWQQFSRRDRFFDYIAEDDDGSRIHVLQPMRDKHFDLAVVTRFGDRGNLTLVGGGLRYNQLKYPGQPRIERDGEFVSPVADDSIIVQPALSAREELSAIRLVLLLGQRNVWWVKRRGLDSMRGEQDVQLGIEAGLALARSVPSLEVDDDVTSTFSLYTALERGPVILAARGWLDARRDFAALPADPNWEDIFAESELIGYWHPSSAPRHTVVLRAAGAAAWNTTTPFQLTLGGDRNLRGYRHDRFPGGHRLVVTGEHRFYWGWPRRQTLDLGNTLFVDAGRMWPGDAPYGRDSGWRATIGAGLRISFPAGSRTTYRLDFALPVHPRPNARDLRLMISVGEILGLSAPFSDPQLRRSRGEGMAGELVRFRP